MSVEWMKGRRALTSGRFGGAGAFQLFMVNFYMKTLGAAPALFYWNQTSKNRNVANSFYSTPQPNTPKARSQDLIPLVHHLFI
jgi:hypothetical protein